MKKAMISQPMAGKTEEEIKETRARLTVAMGALGYEVINTLFEDEWYSLKRMTARGIKSIPLYFLGKSLEAMSKCEAVCFSEGWEKARGCKLENAVARAYGLATIYEAESNE